MKGREGKRKRKKEKETKRENQVKKGAA